MSALGRHRDSILNLSALAHQSESEEEGASYGAEASDEAFYCGEGDGMFEVTVDDDESLFDVFLTNPDAETAQLPKTPFSAEHGQQYPSKSILKTARKKVVKPQTGNDKQQQGRRTIFCTVNDTSPQTTSSDKKVTFAEKRKVFIMPSLDPFKEQIWWDPHDYFAFKRTAVFLANSIPTDGAESWLIENNNSESSLSVSPTSIPNVDGNVPEEKWWCKFGHSRRGLEHICCEKEGNARQRKVIQAINAVLDEQDRKKQRGKVADPSTLARISGRHTKWARDLALAAGFADAKSVATDFDEALKIHRNDYIKTARAVSASGSLMGNVMASFLPADQRKLLGATSDEP